MVFSLSLSLTHTHTLTLLHAHISDTVFHYIGDQKIEVFNSLILPATVLSEHQAIALYRVIYGSHVPLIS